MKRTIIFAAAIFTMALLTSSVNAQTADPGTGQQPGTKVNWVDANGDGICDNVGTSAQGVNRSGKGYGKKDGTGIQARPQDGTGYGAKAKNSTGNLGSCDGTSAGSQSRGRMGKK